MKEALFREWQIKYGSGSKKYKGDTVSRLKRLERELYKCNLDQEFEKDNGQSFLLLFKNKGEALESVPHGKLPVGINQIGAYKTAVKEYFKFKAEEKK